MNSCFKIREGFSLMELLIVIFIISLVYFLGFEGFSPSDIIQTKQTPLVMLQRLTQQSHEGKLICVDNCQTCFFKDSLSSKVTKLDTKFNLGKEVTIYKLNDYQNLTKVEFGRYQDHKICMILDFYPNGSHTKFVFKNDKKIYFVSSFFDDIKELNSLEDAQKLWISDINALHNGDFF